MRKKVDLDDLRQQEAADFLNSRALPAPARAQPSLAQSSQQHDGGAAVVDVIVKHTAVVHLVHVGHGGLQTSEPVSAGGLTQTLPPD